MRRSESLPKLKVACGTVHYCRIRNREIPVIDPDQTTGQLAKAGQAPRGCRA